MSTPPDIFLSYNREDQVTARRFAEAFEAQGFEVWWDATLRSGEAYDEVTEQALKTAKAVVVLWSKKSVVSRWVRAEATLANRNKTLVPVMIEPCERPIMFELTHTADLSRWNGDPADAAWRAYLADVRRFVENGRRNAELSGETVRSNAPGATGEPRAQADGAPSIAVLPFVNLSGDKEQEYFSDGLAEEILNALAQIDGLKVVARTSAFAFKGQNTDIRKISAALGVSNVLEGSVRRAGNRLRVTAQLIRASDGTHLWSQRYDREMIDVFAVQDEIAAAIADHLKVHFTRGKKQTTSVAAYEAFLEGRHHWDFLSPDEIARAYECYQRAIALDPSYAPPHAGLSEYHMGSAILGLAAPTDAIPKVEAAARRALELDATLADAYGMLGHVAAFLYRWDEAKSHFLRAIELNDAAPHAVHPYTVWYLLSHGLFDEALAATNRLLVEDPISVSTRYTKARVLANRGQLEEAVEWSRKALEVDPHHFFATVTFIEFLAHAGQFERAIAEAERAAQTFGRMSWTVYLLGTAYGLAGRVDDARRAAVELHGLVSAQRVLPCLLATLHAVLGESDAAFSWAGRAVGDHDPFSLVYFPSWKRFRRFDLICADPRYAELLKKMNL